MEVYKGRLIAYSLGNFCGYRQFGTPGDLTSVSVVLEAEVAGNGVLQSAKVTPLFLDKTSVPALDPQRRAIPELRALSSEDFPETGVRVDDDGTLHWGP